MHSPIPRRTFLKASGIAIALPLLESMGSPLGQEVQPPKRMVLICNTLGLYPPSLYPKETGADYKDSEYLKILSEHRNNYTLFSGLSHPDQNGKEPHDTEMTWLTSARNPGLDGFKNSISIDQYAAAKLGQVTRFNSINLSTNSKESQSYTSNGVMLPAEIKPSKVFEKLFLGGSVNEMKRTRQKLKEGRSILDYVAGQSKSLQRRASNSDQQQLEQYFEAVRKAESELTQSEAWLDKPKPTTDEKPPKDIVDARDLIGRTQSLLNMIPLVLQTDSSRVVTVMIQDHHVVPQIKGVNAEHHNLSHHGKDPAKINQLKMIERELLKQFSGFLSKMSQPLESDSNLLDSTSVLFGSNLGNANAHDPSNLPIFLAGGGFQHGKYVAFDKSKNTPLCNLFVNLLHKMGIEADRFGTSTGTLEI